MTANIEKKLDEIVQKLAKVIELLDDTPTDAKPQQSFDEEDQPFRRSTFYPQPIPDSEPAQRVCPKCDIELSNVMSYSCSVMECPTGLGSFKALRS